MPTIIQIIDWAVNKAICQALQQRGSMKVYIAKRHHDYEGYDILGVCSTKEAAEQRCQADTASDGDGCSVDVYEIDGPGDA